MRVVVALGWTALLRHGQELNAENQRQNIRLAAVELAAVHEKHELIIAHGNGPQVGLLALMDAAYSPAHPFPLDILGAETVGMIGYMIEQELGNLVPFEDHIVTILTQILVDPADPAFDNPTKPVGPIYERAEAERRIAEDHPRLVTEGRDQGSVVFPDAGARFYLDADVEVRAGVRRCRAAHVVEVVAAQPRQERDVVGDHERAVDEDGNPMPGTSQGLLCRVEDHIYDTSIDYTYDHLGRVVQVDELREQMRFG